PLAIYAGRSSQHLRLRFRPLGRRRVQKSVGEKLTTVDVEFQLRSFAASERDGDELELRLDPPILAKQVTQLPQRHAGESGIASVDLRDQVGDQIEVRSHRM